MGDNFFDQIFIYFCLHFLFYNHTLYILSVRDAISRGKCLPAAGSSTELKHDLKDISSSLLQQRLSPSRGKMRARGCSVFTACLGMYNVPIISYIFFISHMSTFPLFHCNYICLQNLLQEWLNIEHYTSLMLPQDGWIFFHVLYL